MNRSKIYFLLALLIAVIVRTYTLDNRPLHHDEGVNFHFFIEVLKEGYYKYSHLNYHGPLFFYIHAAFLAIFGDSVFMLRLPEALLGSILTVIPLICLKSRFSGFLATFLILASATVQFYSGYFIHEIWLALCSLMFSISVYQYFAEDNKKSLIFSSFYLALCFSLKETIVLALPGIVLALLFIIPFKKYILSTKNAVTSDGPQILSIFLFTTVFIYTASFTWPDGILELLKSFPQWFDRGVGDTGHFKPWNYYIKLAYKTETLIFTAFLLPFFYFLKDRDCSKNGSDLKLALFLSIANLVTFIAYSLIPYKMPWLHLQWVTPLWISTACCLVALFNKKQLWLKTFGLVLILVAIVSQSINFYRYVVKHPFGPSNPLSYVHSTRGLETATNIIKKYLQNNPTTRVAITTSAWPIPYYLRKVSNQVDYFDKITVKSSKYPIMLIDSSQNLASIVPPFDNCFRKEYFRLSDYSEAYLLIDGCRLVKKTAKMSDKIKQ